MEDKLTQNLSEENPLQALVSGGGFCGCLRSVACIGDSLSSGEFESIDAAGEKQYHDMFEFSWGQFMAREAGLFVRNFSRGGMTAEEYCESFADQMGYWDPEKRCRAYIIALGVNDVSNHRENLGEIADVHPDNWRENPKTFAGYYGQIISRIKEIEPRAKIFLMTIPRIKGEEDRFSSEDRHAQLLHEIAQVFESTYVLDLRRYAPVWNEEFRRTYCLGGHLNAMGYQLGSRLIMTYIDYIMRNNPGDFAQIGFVGTPYCYPAEDSHKEGV